MLNAFKAFARTALKTLLHELRLKLRFLQKSRVMPKHCAARLARKPGMQKCLEAEHARGWPDEAYSTRPVSPHLTS